MLSSFLVFFSSHPAEPEKDYNTWLEETALGSASSATSDPLLLLADVLVGSKNSIVSPVSEASKNVAAGEEDGAENDNKVRQHPFQYLSSVFLSKCSFIYLQLVHQVVYSVNYVT